MPRTPSYRAERMGIPCCGAAGALLPRHFLTEGPSLRRPAPDRDARDRLDVQSAIQSRLPRQHLWENAAVRGLATRGGGGGWGRGGGGWGGEDIRGRGRWRPTTQWPNGRKETNRYAGKS